jgi:L-seryl-tRNA(Ser) seleniumtransferase
LERLHGSVIETLVEMSSAPHLRDLPSVDTVLSTASATILRERFGRAASIDAIRTVLGRARERLRAGAASLPTAEQFALEALAWLDGQDRSALRPLFNLTGTVLHTNFGRAVLAKEAIDAAIAAMRDPVALEIDLSAGKRGERDDHVRALLCALSGAEDATIVNNNAAAVLLCLNSLAEGREAIVSRGELIEIGGAFRMPEIMARAGVRLVEVGTTNRTHAKDYRAALTPQTGVMLKIHPSNYRIQGFTAEVHAPELAAIAAEANVPLVHDLGSGTLVDLSRYELEKEPTVREAVAQGAGVVTFSGDKLLGGPQAGFIVGKRELIEAINRNPMKRALRVDKIRLAAIEATLKLYRDPDRLAQRLPTLRLLARLPSDIRDQARRVLPAFAKAIGPGFSAELCECESQVGSGALPLDTIPSAGLSISSSAGGHALERLAGALRSLSQPVIGRIESGALILDFRCLADEEALLSALSELSPDT